MIDDQSDPGAWADAIPYLPTMATEYRPRVSNRCDTRARLTRMTIQPSVSSDGGPAGLLCSSRMDSKREINPQSEQ